MTITAMLGDSADSASQIFHLLLERAGHQPQALPTGRAVVDEILRIVHLRLRAAASGTVSDAILAKILPICRIQRPQVAHSTMMIIEICPEQHAGGPGVRGHL